MLLSKPIFMGFLSTMLGGIYIALTSTTWLGSWIGLELNLMSFIPIIIMKGNSRSAEAALKYFLVQAFKSLVFLTGAILLAVKNKVIESDTINSIMLFALLLKLGAAPLHFWFPHIMQGLDWSQCFLLMTVQKIAPLSLISYIELSNISYSIIMMFSILSALAGAIGGLNQTDLRKLLAYSSINHLSWLLASLCIDSLLWISYLLVYCLISGSILFMFYNSKSMHMNQLLLSPTSVMNKIVMFMSLYSLGGLPPFLGFLPKLIILMELVSVNHQVWAGVLLSMSIVTLFYYNRLIASTLTLAPVKTFTAPKTMNKSALVILVLMNILPVFVPLSWFLM
uniref:NADH dehydrogenase subunit 2 n=1 Tax=Anchistus australis TaxID=1296376 RepID=UPI0013E95D57|nr:NADH dehydrogenase subunit 2 [Anchistus australis]QHR79566.1 NADH dehydrogenase subunit 2 [Anchistus australis]